MLLKSTLFVQAFLLFTLAACGSGGSRLTLPTSKALFSTASNDVRLWSYRYKISGLKPSALAPIDAYHRGLQDVLVANAGSSDVCFFKNQGNGTFKETAKFLACTGASSLDAEDLTGDGIDDFLVICPDSSQMSLFIGDGHGGFTRRDIAVSQGIVGAQSAPHVSQPGTPFLSILHGGPARLELLRNQGDGVFTFAKELPAPAAPIAFVSDRFTSDGGISYAVVSAKESKFSVYLNRAGQYERKDYLAPEGASGIVALDMREVGVMDLAITSGKQNLFRIYFNDGDGNFVASEEYRVPGGPISGLGSSHLRGKIQQELITEETTTGDIVIYPSLGNGKLGTPEVIHAGGSVTGLTIGHFIHSSDGMDIALIDTQTSELVILLNERDNY